MPTLLRSFTTVVVGTALWLSAPVAPADAAQTDSATETSEAQTKEVVELTLKIAASGQSVGQIARVVELDTSTALSLRTDGHQHAIAIMVRKVDDRGRTLAVTVGYERDGKEVLDTVTVEAAAKKAKIIRSEGGDVALSLTLAPKVVAVEEAPTRPRLQVVEDTNDPLAGVD